MITTRTYWVSNNRGEKDCHYASNLSEVKNILTKDPMAKAILKEDGYIAGGYTLHRNNGDSVVSNGEFRLNDNKVTYHADYTEKQ